MKPVQAVRPLSICLEPILGESLNGFVSRSFALSPIRDRSSALRLVGIGRENTDLRRALETASHAENLATVLGCTPDMLVLMSLPPRSWLAAQQRNFYGTWIQGDFIELQRRRVSPRALAQNSFHRSTWQLRMFKLDGSTLEPLIDTCPICGTLLGWGRAVQAHFCDRCVDQHGRPNVDLREFSQPPHDLTDPDGYRFMHDLIDPAAVHRRPSSRDPSWASIRSRSLLELGLLLAKLLGSTANAITRRPTARSMKQFFPDVMALAGRCLMDGRAGLKRAEGLLSERYGRPILNEAIGANPEVSAGVRHLIETEFGPPASDGKEYQTLTHVRTHQKIPADVLRRFVATGGATVGDGYGLRYHIETIERIAPEFHDAVDSYRVVAILGILPRDVATLIRMNLIRRPSEKVRALLSPNVVCASDVSNLLGSLDDRASDYDSGAMSLREFCRTRPYPCTLGIVLAAAQAPQISLVRLHCQSACWADAFGSLDLAALDAGCLAINENYPQAVRAVEVPAGR